MLDLSLFELFRQKKIILSVLSSLHHLWRVFHKGWVYVYSEHTCIKPVVQNMKPSKHLCGHMGFQSRNA